MTTVEAANPAKTAPKIHPAIRRIVLTGFMGAGKTTVGRLLAAELGWKFVDLDAHLEVRAGAKVAEIFAQQGEAQFRKLESSALASALGQVETVLALGGGTPEQLTNRLLLEQTPGTLVVFLDAPFEALFDRCMLQSFAQPEHSRPVLAVPAQAAAKFATRQPIYRRLAKLTLATGETTAEENARMILDTLGKQNI